MLTFMKSHAVELKKDQDLVYVELDDVSNCLPTKSIDVVTGTNKVMSAIVKKMTERS
jgi:hypothetical protein